MMMIDKLDEKKLWMAVRQALLIVLGAIEEHLDMERSVVPKRKKMDDYLYKLGRAIHAVEGMGIEINPNLRAHIKIDIKEYSIEKIEEACRQTVFDGAAAEKPFRPNWVYVMSLLEYPKK